MKMFDITKVLMHIIIACCIGAGIILTWLNTNYLIYSAFLFAVAAFMIIQTNFLGLSKEISDLKIFFAELIKQPAPQKEQISQEEQEVIEAEKLAKEILPEKEELEFYDLKEKQKFKTTNYEIVIKNNRRFAVADAPSGIKSWKILGKE